MAKPKPRKNGRPLGRLLFGMIVGSILLGGAVYGYYWYANRPDPVAVAPAFLAADPQPVGQRSVINVPFRVPLERVRTEINDQIPNVILRINEERQGCVNQQVDLLIAQPNVRIDCRIRGAIRKDGDLRLFGEDGKLQVRMPIRFRINVEGVDGLVAGVQTQVNGALVVQAEVVPNLQRDWDFVVRIDSDFRWTERAHAELLGFDFDFADQLRPEIQKALDDLKPELRKMLQDANIKGLVQRAWRQLQRPQKLSSDPNVWLVAHPRNVQFSGFEIKRNAIEGQLALVADTETVVGARPETGDPEPLPNLRNLNEDLPSGFDLAIPVTVPYTLIRRELMRADLGSRIVEAVDPDQYDLQLSKFEVYPSGDAISIGFDFVADAPGVLTDAEGRAYVSAVPVVNWDRRVLRLRQLQFASVANNAVIDAATFLISQRPVMELAEESAWISFANEYDFALESVNEALTGQDLGEGVTLSGRLRQTDISDIELTEEGIRIIVTLRGRLNIRVGQ